MKQVIATPIGTILEQLLKYTCSLSTYKNENANNPKPNGGAILFQYAGERYMFSAAHVIGDENLGKTYFILNDNGRVGNIGGHYYIVQLPETGNRYRTDRVGNRYHDNIDAAMVHLNDSTSTLLESAGYQFLDIDRIETGYQITEYDQLLIAGYPHTMRKLKITDRRYVHHSPFLLHTLAYSKDLAGKGFPSQHHYAAIYQRKGLRITNSVGGHRGPKPIGLSGTGLWLIKPHSDLGLTYKLIGIQTTYLDNPCVFVATKIDFFIETIKQYVNSAIPNYGWRPRFEG